MGTIKSSVNYLGNSLLQGIATCFEFCDFIGKLTLTLLRLITLKTKLNGALFNKQLYEASCKLVLPLCVLTIIISSGLILSANPIIKQFNLEQHVVRITNIVLLRDTLPPLIALTLAFHFAIRLIDFASSKHKDSPERHVQQHVLSRIIAISIAGPLLYLYIVVINFITIFFILSVRYHIILPVYIATLRDNIQISFFIIAILKTFISTIIVGLIASFYYSKFNQKRIALDRAVSYLMTRVIFWLIISNGLLVTLIMNMGY